MREALDPTTWVAADRRMVVNGLDPSYEPREAHDGSAPPPPEPLDLICPEDDFGVDIPAMQWVVSDWMPRGVVTGLYGAGGFGKTILAIQLQAAAAKGGEWAAQAIERPMRSLGVYCEDSKDELRRRFQRIASAPHIALTRKEMAAVRLTSRLNKDSLLMTFDSRGRADLTPFHKQLIEQMKDEQRELFVFDSASDGFAGNENDRSQVKRFVSLGLGTIAEATNAAVLLLAHPSRAGVRDGTGESGSTGWDAAFRSRCYMSAPPQPENGEPVDPEIRTLERLKANYAKRNDLVTLRLRDGYFVTDAPAKDAARSLPASQYEAKAEEVFLALLARYTSQGRETSAAASSCYAPAEFARERDSALLGDKESHRKRALANAMRRLFAKDAIHIATIGPKSKERRRVALGPPPQSSQGDFLTPNGGAR